MPSSYIILMFGLFIVNYIVFLQKKSGVNVVINYLSNYNLHRYTLEALWCTHATRNHTPLLTFTHSDPPVDIHMCSFRPKPHENSTLNCEATYQPRPPCFWWQTHDTYLAWSFLFTTEIIICPVIPRDGAMNGLLFSVKAAFSVFLFFALLKPKSKPWLHL